MPNYLHSSSCNELLKHLWVALCFRFVSQFAFCFVNMLFAEIQRTYCKRFVPLATLMTCVAYMFPSARYIPFRLNLPVIWTVCSLGQVPDRVSYIERTPPSGRSPVYMVLLPRFTSVRLSTVTPPPKSKEWNPSENSLMFPFSLPENQTNLTQGYWYLV